MGYYDILDLISNMIKKLNNEEVKIDYEILNDLDTLNTILKYSKDEQTKEEIITYLESGEVISKPSYEDKINMCFHHLDYLLKIKSEKTSVLEMRSHIAWYLKGLPESQSVKNEVFKAKTSEELKNILNNYLKKIKNNI